MRPSMRPLYVISIIRLYLYCGMCRFLYHDLSQIPRRMLVKAAREMKRGITEETVKMYEEWRDCGVGVGVTTD